jgi:DNA repair protein RadA/Sms
MAKKDNIVFLCSECGDDFNKWAGQCPSCKSWNTLKEYKKPKLEVNPDNKNNNSWIGENESKIIRSSDIDSTTDVQRTLTGISELDRVLGNGMTTGSVNLITGEPGSGKSTLLIQALTSISHQKNAICTYVTGEESLRQVKDRAIRLGLDIEHVRFLSETNVENIIQLSKSEKTNYLVIDSIQTTYTNDSNSIAGSVSQVKESAAKFTQYAKKNNVSIFLVGHVTKDGSMAGPKVLEHIIDASLHIEGDSNSRYRIIRTIKNRFGEANETGVFAMTEKGMQCVTNPSAIFINSDSEPVEGSAIFVSKEGNRPLLFEVQSLVNESFSEIPRRLSVGINFNRVSMLLAILQKHNNLRFHDKDVYVNVVGGIQIPNSETSCDLGVCFSIFSSSSNFVIPKNIASFGEISLSGEIRPVPNGEDRIKEVDKQGFKYLFIPKGNYSSKFKNKYKVNIIPVSKIEEATSKLHDLTK